MMYVNEVVNAVQNTVAPMFSNFRVISAVGDYSHMVMAIGAVLITISLYQIVKAFSK